MTQHIEEARKLVTAYGDSNFDRVSVPAIADALAAAEERGRSEERERCAPQAHVVPLREAARQEAVRLVERAGLEMEEEYDLLIEDLTETMLRFAAVEPNSETVTPDMVYFRFVLGDAYGQKTDKLRIRKWDTKPFDGAIEYRAAAAITKEPTP